MCNVNKKFWITIWGQDYSEITIRNLSVTNDKGEKVENPLFSLFSENIIDIIRVFQGTFNQQLKTEVGVSGESKFIDNKKKLFYDESFNSNMFAGVVGIKTGEIEYQLPFDNGSFKTVELNITLKIYSRFDNINKPYFLATMLLRDNIKLTDSTVPNNEEELYDYLLLFWYIEQLQNARLKGYFHTYVRYQKNDDKLRGSIDFAEHIKTNCGQNNCKIAYSYRENTRDNFLNYLIVAAYKYMKKKYYELVCDNIDSNFDLKNIIDNLSNLIGYTDYDFRILAQQNRRKISHPYYFEYEQLRLTCLKILRDESVTIFDDAEDQGEKSILFYLPDLWEFFLEDEMMKAKPADIKIESQPEIKVFDQNNKTYPDFVFSTEINEKQYRFMILDAKFKLSWKEALGGKLGNNLDDYSKCIRDMVSINANATGVIFPVRGEPAANTKIEHPTGQYNAADRFYTFPIYVPIVEEKDSYSEWLCKFKENVRQDIESIRNILEKEKKELNNKVEICNNIKDDKLSKLILPCV